MVCLVEPPDVVMLDEDVAGFAGDGWSFSEFNSGFVVFIDYSGRWLRMAEVFGGNDVFGAFCECFIFRFTRVERNAFFFRRGGKEGSCVEADAEGVGGVARAVRMAGMGGVGRGKQGYTVGVVRRDGGEGGAEMWVTFEVAEELDLVSSVCCGGGVVLCAQVDDFLSAVVAEGGVEKKGAVDALVGCCINGGKVSRGLKECGKRRGKNWW